MRTISLRQKTRENLFTLAWREIALLRTFYVLNTKIIQRYSFFLGNIAPLSFKSANFVDT